MKNTNAKDLLERYNNGTATEAERAIVESWYINYSKKLSPAEPEEDDLEKDQENSLKTLLSGIKGSRPKFSRQYLSIAASITVLLCVGALLFNFTKTAKKQTVANQPKITNSLAPGSNKATLVLSNGHKIVLNDSLKGTLARENGTVINKTAQGQISYSQADNNVDLTNTRFNTAITPRGGQFQLTLADGTRVWLNAASSLTFPVAFHGNLREVTLTGEAYFEVAHDASKPFKVISYGQQVEVLGTHFNINAYNDDNSLKTTLLQGSVKVIADRLSQVLKPGEQAQVENGKISKAAVDVDGVVAWKNGLFYFKDADLKTVMHQLSRWYDVDIKYEGEIPDRKFSGQISRNLNAAQMLDILTFKKINYKIIGRTIVINKSS